ncbi:NADH-quinone oxidoreductase subunit C [Thioalbus denitrificans]|uniref:Ni,Fe-hydrogenase III large subunit n=1 Tax=Thioalbus denitrificans TaxID=547122 RepID=A0A369C412_9GAMM|nr:NADH-quinone oxidoreductase subunit C [Thioalbus denitrificans]RCX26614.1 Ni,Fe-hydrogenase III large subunit [Thioalbus denitrificans]
MSRFDWLSEYLARLEDEHVIVRAGEARSLAPAHRLVLDAEDWGRAGGVAAALGCRWAGVWGDPRGEAVVVRACLEYQGDYLVLETGVPLSHPILASHTPRYPGADRLERHLQDLLGIAFLDHPDSRRWTRHQAWPEGDYPLRPDFPVAGRTPGRAPADTDYPFVRVQGSGVYEIPVGPVHAGIIEPGHFRFQAAGEDVLRLEERLGYVHKGIEKLAVGRDPAALARLAGRVSGDSTVAHAWAACQAMERATECAVPARALHLRALFAERERIANHLGDIGAICNDVGFAFALVQCGRLRERWQRRSRELFGHRLLMDAVVPGGVARDLPREAIAPLRADHADLRREVAPLFEIIDDHPSLDDRLLGTGILAPADARALGCTGYLGRASGLGFDVRRDNPYPPYDRLVPEVPVQGEGDVAARVRVRMAEVRASLALLDRLLEGLPGGDIAAPLPAPAAGATGLGLVEGWRGEILTFVRFGEGGRIERFFPRDPSWFAWPALERLIHGNIVPDFPVCNKSVNGSYSGVDL